MDYTGRIQGINIDFMDRKPVLSIKINEDITDGIKKLFECETIDITLKKHRNKRSLNANAYFHVLCGKIADAIGMSKPRCKNILIGRYGQPELLENGTPAVLKSNIPVSLMLEQETLHCMPCGGKKENGVDLTFYRVYRGTHTYNTEEMSILIDGTVEEAKEIGIDTMPTDKLAHMKAAWGYEKAMEYFY